ncbi:MAG: hypothetical protein K5905_30505 [Roseibium sp.]|nr:hypothetical protein [Roseibium sp.]
MKDFNSTIARSSSKRDERSDVIAAIDGLINEQAFKKDLGRWDFLHSLSEIDASHWAKIVKGSARLTPGKFRLLCKALCEDPAQEDHLKDLYTSYRSSIKRSRAKPVSEKEPEDLAGALKGLAADLDIRCEDFADCTVFREVIRRAIRTPRSAGDFSGAKRNGRILVQGLHNDLYHLSSDRAEEQLIDLMTALCYVAYQTADADLFRFAVKSSHLPAEPKKTTRLLKAVQLHLQRRFNEVFFDVPIEQLLDMQSEANSLAEDSQESCEERMPMGIMIRQNHSRLCLQTGQALARDRIALQRAVEMSDRDGDRFTEFQALCRAYLAKWHLVKGDLDTAQTTLADAISLLDRKLGKFHWARACVREYQAESVLHEIRVSTPSEDLVETCLGYLDDALKNIQVCGNQLQMKLLENKVEQVRNSSL